MEVLLRVEIEVIVFFAFIEELLFHSVLATLEVLSDFELLGAKVVH